MSSRATFELVPRRRFSGTRFGAHQTRHRGDGDEVSGLRTYQPGDRRSTIDWRATARAATARGDEIFLVREFFANRAPTVVVVVDRRPAMGLYPPEFPWLDKARAVQEVVEQIAVATLSQGGELAYVESQRDRVRRCRPQDVPALLRTLARRPRDAAFAAPDGTVEASLAMLTRRAASLPVGTFVFVVSDFLPAPPAALWARLRGRRWDITPVIVQDPLWEQSFPQIGGVAVDIRDPATGTIAPLLLGRREAVRLAAAHAARLERTVVDLQALGLDPVLIDDADRTFVTDAFRRWARRRRAVRRRVA
jgi:uncharacterized protein (DUF58 family)